MTRKRKNTCDNFPALVRGIVVRKVSARKLNANLKAMGLQSLASVADDPARIKELARRLEV